MEIKEGKPILDESAKEFVDYVDKVHEVSGRIKSRLDNLEDPNEDDMLFMYNCFFETK